MLTFQGKTVVILKALGQDQIDQVLRVSEEYKKGNPLIFPIPSPSPTRH